ncbi:MAG: type II toxin-antitoxin system RelE/ParE family toxin [Verrucomicrobiota bacterium]
MTLAAIQDHRFTSAALQELREALLYYETAENGLSSQFLDEVEAAVARIVATPEAWRKLSRRTRRCRTHRFPFGLIYQIRENVKSSRKRGQKKVSYC